MRHTPDQADIVIDELKDLRVEAMKLQGQDREELMATIKMALSQVFSSPELTKKDVSELRDLIENTKVILNKLLI